MMKKHFCLLLAVCLFGMALCAAPVSKRQAQQIAAGWLMSSSPVHRAPADPSMMKTDVVLQAVNDAGDPYLYAVSNGGGGYVLVSGDDRAPAVLGYVERGTYNESAMPDNMRSWLRHYVEEIEFLQRHNLTSEQTVPDLGDPIAKTLTSLWDQLEPYNRDCPMVATYNDAACTTARYAPMRAPTGCAATALAQVLYMWKDEYAKPEVKEGKLSQNIPARVDVVYQSAEVEDNKQVPVWLKFSTPAIPASTTIDWANLIDVYSERDAKGSIITDASTAKGTPEQQAAVARLMQVCGALCEMSYGTIFTGGSGAASHAGAKGAALYMNFPNVRFEQRFMYDYQGWVQRLYDELKVAKAVYFGGSTSTSGHAFVIDGYSKEDLFHVNWGWSGLANEAIADGGYYRINSLLPINQGTGGSVTSEPYSMMQAFYTGLYPNAPQPAQAPSITAAVLNTFRTQVDVKQGKLKLNLLGRAANESSPVITAQVALGMESEAGYRSFKTIGDDVSTFYMSDAVALDTLLTWTDVTDGDYTVHWYYRTALDEDWTLCTGADKAYISVKVSGDKATVLNRGNIELELVSSELKEKYKKGENVTFTLKYKVLKGVLDNYLLMSVANPVKEDEEGDIVSDASREEVKGIPPVILNANAGDEITVSSTFPGDDLMPGLYRVICLNLNGCLPCDLVFEVEGSDTGIEQPSIAGHEVSRQDAWYDLLGRKLSAKPTEPGIYIVDGKKILIK